MRTQTPTLFDDPQARTQDPNSSHIAAGDNERSGRRVTQKEAVLKALKTANGATSNELAVILDYDCYITARRLPDLLEDGLVEQAPMRRCRVCGSQCVTWFLKAIIGPVVAKNAALSRIVRKTVKSCG